MEKIILSIQTIGLTSSESKKAIRGAQEDGMTNAQKDYLERAGSFRCLEFDLMRNNDGHAFQVEYEEETNPKRKPITSSYMFRTYNLD